MFLQELLRFSRTISDIVCCVASALSANVNHSKNIVGIVSAVIDAFRIDSPDSYVFLLQFDKQHSSTKLKMIDGRRWRI